MIDIPPLQPPAQCIAATSSEAARFPMRFIVSGNPAKVDAFLVIAAKKPMWKLESSTSGIGVRMVSFVGPSDVPYRDIGGLIYEAQRRQLAIAFLASQAICGMQQK